jgi:hypothetical protein
MYMSGTIVVQETLPSLVFSHKGQKKEAQNERAESSAQDQAGAST